MMQVKVPITLPVSEMGSDQYSWSRYWKPMQFAYILPRFHSHLRNISQLANLNAGGGTGANCAQSMYSSSHDTIRTHIRILSERSRNHFVEPWSGYNPRYEPWVNFRTGWHPHEDRAGLVLDGSGTETHRLSIPKPGCWWFTCNYC